MMHSSDAHHHNTAPVPAEAATPQITVDADSLSADRWTTSPFNAVTELSVSQRREMSQLFAQIVLTLLDVKTILLETDSDVSGEGLGRVAVTLELEDDTRTTTFSHAQHNGSNWIFDIAVTPERVHGYLYPADLLRAAERSLTVRDDVTRVFDETTTLHDGAVTVTHRNHQSTWWSEWALDSDQLTSLLTDCIPSA